MTSQRQNKFAELINAVRDVDEAPATPALAPPALGAPAAAPLAVTDSPRRGRPPTGKRSNPDFEQVTAYIRRDTNLQTKIALLQEGDTRDFSDLVEELLQGWLLKQ